MLMESKEFEASMHATTHNELQEQCQTLAAEQEQCKEQIAALKAKLFAVTNAEVRQQGKRRRNVQVLARFNVRSYFWAFVLLPTRPNETHPGDIVAVAGPGQ